MKSHGQVTLEHLADSMKDLDTSIELLTGMVGSLDYRFDSLEAELRGFKADMYIELSQKADKSDIAAVREEIEALREDNQRFVSDVHDTLSKRITAVEDVVATRRPLRP